MNPCHPMHCISSPLADLLMEAMHICMEVHYSDRDRRGMPYVLHPIRIMDKQTTIERKIIALLHDVLECNSDKINIQKIRETFGDNIANSVIALTRQENEDWLQYIDRLIKDKDAAMIKLADLEDNMSLRRMDGRAAQKYANAYVDGYQRICTYYGINSFMQV